MLAESVKLRTHTVFSTFLFVPPPLRSLAFFFSYTLHAQTSLEKASSYRLLWIIWCEARCCFSSVQDAETKFNAFGFDLWVFNKQFSADAPAFMCLCVCVIMCVRSLLKLEPYYFFMLLITSCYTNDMWTFTHTHTLTLSGRLKSYFPGPVLIGFSAGFYPNQM